MSKKLNDNLRLLHEQFSRDHDRLREELLASLPETAPRVRPGHAGRFDRPFMSNRWKVRLTTIGRYTMKVGIAAMILIALTVLLTPRPNGNAEAAQFLAQAAEAVANLQSMHIKCRLRTSPRDNFELIGIDYDFVDIHLWKEFGEKPKWRLEEPGRVVVMDGDSTVMLIRPNIAWKWRASHRGLPSWAKPLIEPDKLLDDQLRTALSREWDMRMTHEKGKDGSPETVLAIEATTAVGPNDYLRNKSIPDSDTRRVFRFDAETKRLERMEVYVHADQGDVLVLETAQIEFDVDLDPDLFVLELPEDTIWLGEPEILPDNEKYARMGPEEMARAFFEACASEDWDEVLKFENMSAIPESTKKYLGGLEVIHIGKAFKAGKYPGWFVPYEIRLKDGYVKKFNLAVRNDNKAKRYVVDGGI